jgi:hypothetical protein
LHCGLDNVNQPKVLLEIALRIGALGLAPHPDDVIVLVDRNLGVEEESYLD